MKVWLSLAKAIDYTGLSESTLRRAVKTGTLAAYRVNNEKLLRFRVDDLDAYLKRFRVEVAAS